MSNPDPPVASPGHDGAGHTRIGRVFIVGAGTMGREIALQCARHGVSVCLHDSSAPALEQAARHFQRASGQPPVPGSGEHADAPAVLARLATRADLRAVAQADLVIECVPENLALKRRVFEQVSAHCRPETILATNTSSLVPSQLAASCRHPERLAALHFHLPVAVSNVVDLMPHPGTDPAVVASLERFARRIGQIPIRYAQEQHGYIFNSLFGAMQRQALDLVIQGTATFADVDRSWMGVTKMPVGPFGMFDQIGLDTIAEITAHWAETLDDEAGRRRVAFLRRWTDQGFVGAKANRGFYDYPEPDYARPGFLG